MCRTSYRFKSKGIYAGTFIGLAISLILVFIIRPYNIFLDALIILFCTIVGMVIGLIFHSLYKPPKNDSIINLHQEKMKIAKRKVQTGDVTIRKEILHELKYISIPITKEVLVIENSKVDPSNGKRVKEEIIRIPYKEERLNIEKKVVQLEDISVFKKQFTEFQRYKDTLKEEKIKVNVSGDINVIDKDKLKYK